MKNWHCYAWRWWTAKNKRIAQERTLAKPRKLFGITIQWTSMVCGFMENNNLILRNLITNPFMGFDWYFCYEQTDAFICTPWRSNNVDNGRPHLNVFFLFVFKLIKPGLKKINIVFSFLLIQKWKELYSLHAFCNRSKDCLKLIRCSARYFSLGTRQSKQRSFCGN